MFTSYTQVQLYVKYLIIFLYSFCFTLWSTPYVVGKLRKYGYLVQDKYKKGKKMIPTMGGIAMLIGILISLSLSQILLAKDDLGSLFIFYFIVIVFALYGIVDDLFSFKHRYDKIIALLILTFPIASLIVDTKINMIFFYWEIGPIYSLLIIPIYIMVVANMVNLHAGFNGLTQGLSLILLITLGIKSYLMNGLDNLLYIVPVLGAAIAFFPSTFYPAKILPGNSGDFLVGSAIGAFIAVNHILWFGIFIMIPHIINFIMDSWTLLLKKKRDVKFGRLREDGTIEAPETMRLKSLKFLIVDMFKLTEKQAVLVLYGLTLFFCIAGLAIF